MASTLPPVRGAAFSFAISLVSQADTDTFQDNPTLAAGDVKIVKDGVLDDNIDSLPTAVTSLTRVLNVALSATEMTADRVDVLFHDAAGSEWQDALVSIYTAAQTLDTTDGVADTINGVVGHTDYGNAKLVRATTPANTLDVAAGGEASVNVTFLKDVALTETGAGYLAAAFKKMFDVAVPVLTAASVNQTGDAFARLGAPAGASMSADIAALPTDADVQTAAAAALTAYDPPTHSELTTALSGADDATLAAIALLATQASVNDLPTNAELASALSGADDATLAAIAALNNLSAAQVNAEVVDVLRTDTIPDSYAADGAQPTIAQAILAIQQFLTEKAVSGTTVTVKKPNGSTAMTFTLNDGTSPSSITRAS